MPAYKKLISRTCQVCQNSPGRFEVLNRFNTSCGYYCAHHANQEVKRLNLIEEEYKHKEKQDEPNKTTN